MKRFRAAQLRLAQILWPDPLLSRREHASRIESIFQPLIKTHGGVVVEVELRGDEIHLGNMGAVAGKLPLMRVFDQGLAECASAGALLGIVAVENDRAGVDEGARGGAGQAAIVIEAFGVE